MNPGCLFDGNWVNDVPHISSHAVAQISTTMVNRKMPLIKGKRKAAWLLRAISCTDLTTLSGDDTKSYVTRLCQKAANPLPKDTLHSLGLLDEASEGSIKTKIQTAAVCVYPSRVADAVQALDAMNLHNEIGIASVAAGFPSGQYSIESRLQEITDAVANGATEIDIVIDRSLVLTKQWENLYYELKRMKEACQHAHMKSILATGEIGSYTNIYKASLIAMMAGSDFIKTSTGKESINATLAVAFVMCRAIDEYYRRTGYKVGFKPAGGIRKADDALNYLIIIKELLGNEWLNSKLFRIGASGVLLDIQKELHFIGAGYYPNDNDFVLE